ncbi:hypothetical protein R3W88_008275 [Solanum pinnatisectum]|uniref:Gag-pol polyprotein n=1 Tax=Solanum pinnatisectum TaxID=50273 RepID=A0AAV9MAP9_9SOLN|nr:hypothetical protein R3W88_008275 [Solanum pinnatisectum]
MHDRVHRFVGGLDSNYIDASARNDNMDISRIQAFAQVRTTPSRCATCGRMHFERCRMGSTGFYSYGQEGHEWRNCPTIGQGGIGQSTWLVAVSSSSVQSTRRRPQTSVGRGRREGREGASSSGSGQNRTYSLVS